VKKNKPLLHLLILDQFFIFEQLQLEEALLRLDNRNWCILNQGSSPAIVLGISGQPLQLVNQTKMKQNPLPLIRRFSGGGTVVIDENTLFSTLICGHSALPVHPYPQSIMQWTAELYQPLFPDQAFALKENDYTINGKKWGGNAQLITRNRWLHHSSILWNYQQQYMDYLLFPPKSPDYRQKRSHADFICRLADYHLTIERFNHEWLHQLAMHFDIVNVDVEEVKHFIQQPHRRVTCLEAIDEFSKNHH